jgi:hypothetical protein
MKQTKIQFRRIASNEVITPEGQCLIQHVVELSDGIVSSLYPLTMEQANTEWMQGRLVLVKSPDGLVRAYYKNKPLT